MRKLLEPLVAKVELRSVCAACAAFLTLTSVCNLDKDGP